MADPTRDQAFEQIRSNIARHGHHVYVVAGGEAVPRFGYTIGLSEALGTELVLAGATVYTDEQVRDILNAVAAGLRAGQSRDQPFELAELGAFTLVPVHASWVRALLLGAIDFLRPLDVQALQLVPDEDHRTVDVPAMDQPWDGDAEPVWQWLHRPWPWPVPAASTAVTNVDALLGYAVTEAARWEPDQWELYSGAGPEVPRDQIRIVPLATLVGFDPSLDAAVRLDVGRALWRDGNGGPWQAWN